MTACQRKLGFPRIRLIFFYFLNRVRKNTLVNWFLNTLQVQPAVTKVLSTDAKSRYLDNLNSFREFPHDFVHNLIIGSNTIALDSAAQKCHSMDIIPVVMTSQLCGKASQVCCGRQYGKLHCLILASLLLNFRVFLTECCILLVFCFRVL